MTVKKERTFPYDYGLRLLQGKWQPKIISAVYYHQHITYSDLRAYLSPISDTVLSLTLHKLMDEGVVRKEVMPRTPMRVDGYTLTKKGRALVPVLHVLCRWSTIYRGRGREHFEPVCMDCPIRKGLRDPLQCADDYHYRACPADETTPTDDAK